MASVFGRERGSQASPGPHRVACFARRIPLLSLLLAPLLLLSTPAHPQDTADSDNPLDSVHITTPPPVAVKADPSIPLTPGATLRTGIQFRVDTNIVLVPLTVTDPMDRLVTGLEKENFLVLEDNHNQAIRTFSCDDAPVSIGVILDLSGSMSNKVVRRAAQSSSS